MTIRQQILRLAYPALTGLQRRLVPGRRLRRVNAESRPPARPLYSLSVELGDGKTLPLSAMQGTWILLVNTASDCGYTAQLAELQALVDRHGKEVAVIGFPSNEFRQQEKGTDEEIGRFCQLHYGVRFPLAKKSSVLPGSGQHPVYTWLTDARLNGWNDRAPEWNFTKYLVNRQGILTHYFAPAVSPLDEEILAQIKT
ncbi:MAG TPA: glutathione peroxidase [Chitinophagaceae bacterium]|nr:glutathione peroxidase [Chitinophagaceae bacterium]